LCKPIIEPDLFSKGFFRALAVEVIHPESESLGSHYRAALIAVSSVALLLLLSLSLLLSDAPKHFLNYSEDNYKIAFASGNFTAAATRDMPRVVFGHTHPVLSPEFGVSSQKLYVFNDTNGDGVFSRSEAIYTSYLDSHLVAWNMSTVEFGSDPAGNEYAQIWMRTKASLYAGIDEVPDLPVISDWAIVTFSYRISERATNHSNVLGTYVVSGKTEMTMSFTITLLKHVDADGIVLEMYVHGGGSTNMLQLREATGAASQLTNVSSSLDESVLGTNFTHRFMQTERPLQDIYMAKEDGIVQAFYHFSSAPMNGSGGSAGVVRMNSSYYTDGAGMILHQAFFIANGTDALSQQSSLGIDELGFNVSVKDWFQDHLPMLMVVCGTIAAAILLPAFVIMYRRYRKSQSGDSHEPSQKRKSV
jgi:hypothetical protein